MLKFANVMINLRLPTFMQGLFMFDYILAQLPVFLLLFLQNFTMLPVCCTCMLLSFAYPQQMVCKGLFAKLVLLQ